MQTSGSLDFILVSIFKKIYLMIQPEQSLIEVFAYYIYSNSFTFFNNKRNKHISLELRSDSRLGKK